MTSKQKHSEYNCSDIESLVQRYLDANLSEEEKQAFEEHLEYCLPCDKKVQFETKLKSLLKNKMTKELSSIDVKSKMDELLKNL